MSRSIFLMIFVAALASALTYMVMDKNTGASKAKKESAFERVTRTNTLRCGWASWPPNFIVKDPNTGKMSGALVDLMERMGKNMHVKIEWAEETGWGAWIQGLRDNRFDAFCSSAWQKAEAARDVRFGVPIFYNAVYGYARSDDHRFDHDLNKINDPTIKVSSVDGEISDLMPKNFFPRATQVSLPEMSELTQMLMNVTNKKADVVFNEPSFVEGYMQKNPGKLHRFTPNPVQVYNSSYAVAMDEDKLMQMLDTALIELKNTGVVDQILTKHGLTRELVPRVAIPYQQNQ